MLERTYAIPIIRNYVSSIKDGTKDEINLDTVPYEVLRALACGHGFYLSTKVPIPMVLRYRLKRYTTNIIKQDRQLRRECLVHYLTQRELDWACYRRGFFPEKYITAPTKLDDGGLQHNQREEQEDFLLEWIRRSTTMDPVNQATDILFSLMLSTAPNGN